MKAFSLIELLVSLIIISIITTIFIPVITKKIKYQNISSAQAALNCKKFDSKNRCILCSKEACSLCSNQFDIDSGLYIDPKSGCEPKNCAANCTKCNEEGCLQCNQGYSLIEGKCLKGNCLKVGNLCVQKFNAGDAGGLEIPSGLVEVMNAVATSDQREHNRAICYFGQTVNTCDSANGNYSGCYRTVCTWYAAVKICQYHGLRLPTYQEALNFGEYSISKKEEGLQFCDEVSSIKSPKCTSAIKCPQSEVCAPSTIWCQRTDGALVPPNASGFPKRNGGSALILSNGVWRLTTETNDSRTAPPACNARSFSVRCVQDL